VGPGDRLSAAAGAAHAEVVEFIADGAEWIWKRVERLRTLAEIPAAKLVEVLDFYHASQYLSETIATSRHLPQAQRRALYKRLRHALRHQADGVEVVLEALRTLATKQRGKAITRALRYIEAHTHRMRYVTLEAHKLPIGSGQVESAVRRVINLRFKAPGSFWTETTVSGLMHLRAAFKAGRWDDVMIGVMTDTWQTPSFAPVSQGATHRSAETQKPGTPQSFIKIPKAGSVRCPLFTNAPCKRGSTGFAVRSVERGVLPWTCSENPCRRPRPNDAGVTPGAQGSHMTHNPCYSVRKRTICPVFRYRPPEAVSGVPPYTRGHGKAGG